MKNYIYKNRLQICKIYNNDYNINNYDYKLLKYKA